MLSLRLRIAGFSARARQPAPWRASRASGMRGDGRRWVMMWCPSVHHLAPVSPASHCTARRLGSRRLPPLPRALHRGLMARSIIQESHLRSVPHALFASSSPDRAHPHIFDLPLSRIVCTAAPSLSAAAVKAKTCVVASSDLHSSAHTAPTPFRGDLCLRGLPTPASRGVRAQCIAFLLHTLDSRLPRDRVPTLPILL